MEDAQKIVLLGDEFKNEATERVDKILEEILADYVDESPEFLQGMLTSSKLAHRVLLELDIVVGTGIEILLLTEMTIVLAKMFMDSTEKLSFCK